MTPDPARCIATLIAGEIGARADQVAASVDLLDGGATVPFVARYRKEATGGLDDTQLRTCPGVLSACATWTSAAWRSWGRPAIRAS
jgi:transcriptional accessory protein Tex/SPT6